MPCYHPLPAWVSSELTENGKYGLSFRPVHGVNERRKMEVPCGTCIGCRLERSRQWAVRITHEAQLYEDNCFVTLTYRDAHLPHMFADDLFSVSSSFVGSGSLVLMDVCCCIRWAYSIFYCRIC